MANHQNIQNLILDYPSRRYGRHRTRKITPEGRPDGIGVL
jgi:hypothetical protein